MDFEGIYCFDTATVRFAVYPDGPGGPRVVAQISENTLRDKFGAREAGDRLLDVCIRHFDQIRPAAIARYRTRARQPITLTLDDFSVRRDTASAMHQAGAGLQAQPA